MDSADVDADALFDRLRPETLSEGEWVVVYQETRLVMARKTVAPEVSLMRVGFDVELAFADAIEMMRPELLCDPRRAGFDAGISDCGVERVLAPGNAITWCRPILSTKSCKLRIGQAAIVGAGEIAAHDFSDALHIRCIVRRAFPSPEHYAFISAPCCKETGTLQQESGLKTTMVSCLCRHPDDPERRCAVTELRLLKRVPDWSMVHLAGHYLQKVEWFAGYKASPIYREVKDGSGFYVVVGLSKLTKGPPLLPEHGSVEDFAFDSGWEDSDPFGDCDGYLRSLFHRLGFEIEVYSTLDDQKLVFYQAVLRRIDWDRARAVLDSGFWRAHSAAYRRKHGGKTAPRLAVAVPRFTHRPVVDAANVIPVVDATAFDYKDDVLPVVGTFVHYREPPGLKLPRTNSNPELDTVA